MRELRGGKIFFPVFLFVSITVAAAVVWTVVVAAPAIPSLFAQFTLRMEQKKPMFQDFHHRRPDRLIVLRLNRQGREEKKS